MPVHYFVRSLGTCRCGGKTLMLKDRRFCINDLKVILEEQGFVIMSNDLTFVELDRWAKGGLIPEVVFDALWDKLKMRKGNSIGGN